jgi:hypothetical protein
MGRVLESPLLNQKSVSLFIEPIESLPCTAFLVPSVPNAARNVLGAVYLATIELVGPINYLHLSTALSATSSIPTTKSLLIVLYKFGKKALPTCSA